MERNYSTDPRSVRARYAFHEALKELLQEKPFNKITVTDISERAGLSRHTFYNHYETKEDLLNNLIDSILDEFFADAGKLDYDARDPISGGHLIGIKFFKIWQDNTELVAILRTVDMERLLLDRLKTLFSSVFYQLYERKGVTVNPALAQYMISYSAFSVASILVQWLKDDMKYPPEVMGDLLNSLSEIRPKVETVNKFNEVVR